MAASLREITLRDSSTSTESRSCALRVIVRALGFCPRAKAAGIELHEVDRLYYSFDGPPCLRKHRDDVVSSVWPERDAALLSCYDAFIVSGDYDALFASIFEVVGVERILWKAIDAIRENRRLDGEAQRQRRIRKEVERALARLREITGEPAPAAPSPVEARPEPAAAPPPLAAPSLAAPPASPWPANQTEVPDAVANYLAPMQTLAVLVNNHDAAELQKKKKEQAELAELQKKKNKKKKRAELAELQNKRKKERAEDPELQKKKKDEAWEELQKKILVEAAARKALYVIDWAKDDAYLVRGADAKAEAFVAAVRRRAADAMASAAAKGELYAAAFAAAVSRFEAGAVATTAAAAARGAAAELQKKKKDEAWEELQKKILVEAAARKALYVIDWAKDDAYLVRGADAKAEAFVVAVRRHAADAMASAAAEGELYAAAFAAAVSRFEAGAVAAMAAAAARGAPVKNKQ